MAHDKNYRDNCDDDDDAQGDHDTHVDHIETFDGDEMSSYSNLTVSYFALKAKKT